MLYKSTPQALSLQDTKKRDRKRDSWAIRHYLLFYFIVLQVSRAHLGKRTVFTQTPLICGHCSCCCLSVILFGSCSVFSTYLVNWRWDSNAMQFWYFSVISRFTHNTLQPYRNFLTVPPPPTTLYDVESREKFGVHGSNIVCGVKRGVEPVWIGKRPRTVDLIRFCLI